MSNKEADISQLRWVRLMTPVNIPTYLVEQVKDRDYSVDDFFKYQELNCMIQDDKGTSLSPFNYLYAMVNGDNMVKGFLWFIIDPLSKVLVVNTYSVDKAYWGKGKAMAKASEHVKEIMKKLKIKTAYWITRYPKHSERNGFRRSRNILMEYSEKQDG